MRVTTSVRAWVSVAWSKCGGSVALADPANGTSRTAARTSGTRARVGVSTDRSSGEATLTGMANRSGSLDALVRCWTDPEPSEADRPVVYRHGHRGTSRTSGARHSG